MKHKLGICIPYRNRKEHLERLVPHLGKYLTEKGIDHKFYVGHQVDDKLFNRGAMKNIAAEYAFNDGCDYIAWHDVDMLPYTNHHDTLPDYSYPEENPTHIATKLSKYNYGLGYDQYFGGVILFTKEQVERTNGYSNDYWDWGQEDDDLFWRCYYEGYATYRTIRKYNSKLYYEFDGETSKIEIPTNREISSCLRNDHTISVLFNASQQHDKVPIWLVGDPKKSFIEYPILRKGGSANWGLSFNNSRAVTLTVFDINWGHYYNWAKRFEGMWTWLTVSYQKDSGLYYFYVNDELVTNVDDIKQNQPYMSTTNLRSHDASKPFILGHCESQNSYYKGKIAEVKIFDRFIPNVNDAIDGSDGLVLHTDFENRINQCNDDKLIISNAKREIDDFEVIENVLPHRREGSFYCMHHEDEGFVNGTWKKGATTARNERRFVTEMQQKKIDYKTDGMNSLKYNLVSTEMFMDNCLMINVTL